MDTTDFFPLIEQLDDNIDDLEEALEPLLKGALSDIAGKLPLLEKAHLHVLVTYAIESILFSYLRLKGVNAKEHPVFRELIRVKQYFEKIKAAESAGIAPTTKLDKAATARFIKHALAGNEKYDANAARQQAAKKAAAHTRFDELPRKLKADHEEFTAPREVALNDKVESATFVTVIPKPQSESATGEVSLEGAATLLKAERGKGRRKRKSQSDGTEAVPDTTVPEDEQKQERKKRKRSRKEQRALG